MNWLLLTRHLESTKNRDDRFAQRGDDDHLTSTALGEADSFCHAIVDFLGTLQVRTVEVFASSTPRAVESVTGICAALHVTPVLDPALASIVVPETAGLSSKELRLLDPVAAWELNLYRAGLFDTYSMRHVGPLAPSYERQIE